MFCPHRDSQKQNIVIQLAHSQNYSTNVKSAMCFQQNTKIQVGYIDWFVYKLLP